jgi:hypothetical protein
VYITAAYALLHGRSPLWGSAFLIVPGTLTSIDRMLLDGPFAALAAAFAYALATHRNRMLVVVLLFAPLLRETGLLFIAAVCAFELFNSRWKQSILFGLTAIPGLAWALWVHLHAPPSTATQIFARPVYGLFLRLVQWPQMKAVPWVAAVVGTAEAIAMACFIAALFIAIWLCLRRKPGPVEIAGLLFALLGFVLAERYYLTESFGYARPISPIFVFLIFRFLSERFTPGLLLTAGVSLPIGSYFAYQALGILHLTPAKAAFSPCFHNRAKRLLGSVMPREIRRTAQRLFHQRGPQRLIARD